MVIKYKQRQIGASSFVVNQMLKELIKLMFSTQYRYCESCSKMVTMSYDGYCQECGYKMY